MVESDATGDEHEDGLEAEGQVEEAAAPAVVCYPEETANDDGVESDGDASVKEGVVREEKSDLPTEEAAESSTDQEEGIAEISSIELLDRGEAEQVLPRQEEQRQHKPRRGPKNHSGPAGSMGLEVTPPTKKLNQPKGINAGIQYTTEVVVQLENRVKEKQKRIDELLRENRTLKNSERLLSKEIEDMQNSKDNFPSKKLALQEELRVCKDRIKQLKEQYRIADEKGFKLHQQSFDLAVKNKGLSEKVRLLEGATTSTCLLSPAPSTFRIGSGAPIEGTSVEEVQAIIASQEEEITRLHQRVALMKKTHKAEQSKYERLLKASQDEIEQTRAEMEEFYQQLFAKERAARVQFLHMKKLKHALHELANTQQTNQRFQQFLANREMRITNRSNHHPRAGPHSPQKGPAVNGGRWITEALHHLGFVMPLAPPEEQATKSLVSDKADDQADIPSNCVQGKLVPFPPPATVGFGASTRAMLYNRSTSGPHSAGNGTVHNYSQAGDGENYDALSVVTGGDTAPRTPENPEELAWGDSLNM
ncbi:Down syndrome critical region protein 3 [Phytophthora pseudosyringae]|uniref:Down syndrome critical region protein 3 n=1 Tax=Phytophthora pseudosyringae TaxID=221518 RepID=A0A8T1VJ60_9STRA|nr:Down syndrome critical region protein 3 [Phytophthora pseudosyringae]